MLYSNEIPKLSRVSVWDCVSDFRCTFKTRSRFWRLPEWTANFQRFNFTSSNFYWPHILKGKADGMHLKNHLLRRRRFSCFPTGFDKRHDSESDKIVSPHWVVVVVVEYTWKQQVENLKNTHWRTESVLSLTWFLFKGSTWRLTRKNCFFFFFCHQ